MGMLNDMYKLDLISNNLSNVDTVGYKKDVAAFKTYMDRMMFSNASDNPFNNLHPIGVLEGAVVLDEVKPVITQGPLEYTGNPYDIAINGEGFFVVDRNGATLYTRAGNFKRNAEGFLVTGRGDFVLSENGNKIKSICLPVKCVANSLDSICELLPVIISFFVLLNLFTESSHPLTF